MPIRFRGRARLRLAASSRAMTTFLTTVATMCVTASRLAAQCSQEVGCPPNQPPVVSFSTGDMTFSTPDVSLTVYVSDDRGINPSSFLLTQNGTTVLSGLSMPAGSTTGSVTVSLHLSAGANVITGQVSRRGNAHHMALLAVRRLRFHFTQRGVLALRLGNPSHEVRWNDHSAPSDHAAKTGVSPFKPQRCCARKEVSISVVTTDEAHPFPAPPPCPDSAF
jgi:hypothetical protein